MNEAASTLQKGILKDYYDESDSPVSKALKKKREKLKQDLIDKLDLKEKESSNG